jgi:DNA-binding NtrC family response regulator
MTLPRILIIDDVLGHPDNDHARRRFCDAMALHDMDASQPDAKGSAKQILAAVRFERAQVVSPDGAVCNDKESALRAIEAGWPFLDDGSRWALVCLDLDFAVGRPDEPRNEKFGKDLLNAIEERWKITSSSLGRLCEIPVVMLSGYDPAIVEGLVHRDANVAFLEKWNGGEPGRFRFELGKILFKTALVPDGMLSRVEPDGEVYPILRKKPILGYSVSILNALRDARLSLLRGRDARVLVMAERGTGKELIARYLHDHAFAAAAYSKGDMHIKKSGRFVQVNLQEVPTDLIASTLKGHVKGAFTSADAIAVGSLETATGGTLHLDEIGNLSIGNLQTLLRLVENDKYMPVGTRNEMSIECQIVMTTNKPILDMVRNGTFPEDLFDRLDKIDLPPLYKRDNDPARLFCFFVEDQIRRLGCRTKKINADAVDRINEYEWPGNVRQLLAVAEQVVVDREHTGNIYSKDIDRALIRTAAELRRNWSGRYKELLTAMKDFSFNADEVESAWPGLKEAIGVLTSKMLQTAYDHCPADKRSRVHCVNLVRGSLGTTQVKESIQCERWLEWLQKYFQINGTAVAAMTNNPPKSTGKSPETEKLEIN